MACKTCNFANKSGKEDFVYCRYWQDKANQSGKELETFVQEELFKETNVKTVGIGWGYPLQTYRGESSFVTKGTATEGIMWANQICIHKEEECQYYKGKVI